MIHETQYHILQESASSHYYPQLLDGRIITTFNQLFFSNHKKMKYT